MRHYRSIVVAIALLLVSSASVVEAQFCENTCPPLNYGTPVPSVCEGDDASSFADVDREYTVSYPLASDAPLTTFSFRSLANTAAVTVISNFYTGCNAGRRESGIFAHLAQEYWNEFGNQIMFVQSLKGGGSASQWSQIYRDDAADLFPDSTIVPTNMPLTVSDNEYEMRDDFFTPPFGHPAYVILDANLQVRHKFMGPCCGYVRDTDCTQETALTLETDLKKKINTLLAEAGATPGKQTEGAPDTETDTSDEDAVDCNLNAPPPFGEWSACSTTCGEGIRFRWREIQFGEGQTFDSCPMPVETQACTGAENAVCASDICIPEVGSEWSIETVVSGLDSPRDVAFHPTPGYHLGTRSEGRTFAVGEEEAWVINGNNHSISIVSGVGSPHQTTLSRRDRGYYHYLVNGTALSFNTVRDSGRSPDRDTFNYWAVCNDNTNDYIGNKIPNYFMGPTLYNSAPDGGNLVNRLGEKCEEHDSPCYFVHSDMLHEAPACIGMVHDSSERQTSHGTVYWTFDASSNHLVRFDFQQPHGPGSMDHSVAAVRRYVEVGLERGELGVHAGMVVHDSMLYIAVPGGNKIVKVDTKSGSFARTAREEYPIFSNRLPSFEYSIWECVTFEDFVTEIDTPTGMAEHDGRLFVASAGKTILVYDIKTGTLLNSIETPFESIQGMSISPVTKQLFFVDKNTDTLNVVKPQSSCLAAEVPSRIDPEFANELNAAHDFYGSTFSLQRDFQCKVNPIIPDTVYFDQVHTDSGYADEDPDVQSEMAGMDDGAALLANRTDCEYDSELNLDALLLGGYFCHVCLPEQDQNCDYGGTCTNVQWQGYVCDNELRAVETGVAGAMSFTLANGTAVSPSEFSLVTGMEYRFVTSSSGELCLKAGDDVQCIIEGGPVVIMVDGKHESIEVLANGTLVANFRVQTDTTDNGQSSTSSGSASRSLMQVVFGIITCLVFLHW